VPDDWDRVPGDQGWVEVPLTNGDSSGHSDFLIR
jgi:hypothetical protein